MLFFKKYPDFLLKSCGNFCRELVKRECLWANVKQGPTDPIFGVTEAYRSDKNPNKVLLGVGAYRTDEGKNYILPSVRKAKQLIQGKDMDHEYPPQGGFNKFNAFAAELAFGTNSSIINDGLNLTVQALGGTGALRLCTAFLQKFYPHCKLVHIPDPTWKNHINICVHSGLEWKPYRYYNPKDITVDFSGMCEDIKKMPDKSIIIFHGVAHNPTGLDPDTKQWDELSRICMEKKLFILFDFAYQGFASGQVDTDAYAVRTFINDGHNVALAQSFSKNFGLYGERVGALTLLASSKEEFDRINSQMKIVIRAMYSTPPLYGARIVTEILGDNDLTCQWLKEINEMATRMKEIRNTLVVALKKAGSQKNWDHIIKQIGMFSYTGLTKEHVQQLKEKHSVYLTFDGRISVASLGSKNVEYVANAIHDVTK